MLQPVRGGGANGAEAEAEAEAEGVAYACADLEQLADEALRDPRPQEVDGGGQPDLVGAGHHEARAVRRRHDRVRLRKRLGKRLLQQQVAAGLQRRETDGVVVLRPTRGAHEEIGLVGGQQLRVA